MLLAVLADESFEDEPAIVLEMILNGVSSFSLNFGVF